MADLMLNFDISGMEGGAFVHLLEFLRGFFVCALYGAFSCLEGVYVYMNWR